MPIFFGRLHPRIVAAVVLWLTLFSAASAQPIFNTVVISDAAAPGTGGAVFDGFSSPILNSHGDVGFRTILRAGPTVPAITTADNTALYAPTAGVGSPLGLLAREGAAAPGTGGGFYSSLDGTFILNDAGQAAFTARVRRGNGGPEYYLASNSAHFVSTSTTDGSPTLLARVNLPAPVSGDAVFDRLGVMVFNGQGGALFTADLRNGPSNTSTVNPNDAGLFRSKAGASPFLVARVGDAVPGNPGLVFGNFNVPKLFADGDFSFGASLREAPTAANPIGAYRGFSIFRSGSDAALPFVLQGTVGGPLLSNGGGAIYGQPGGAGAEIVLLAQSGTVAPGTSDAVFQGFNSAATNTQGDSAFYTFFRSDITDSQTNRLNDSALYGPTDGPGSSLGLLLREGQLIPGTDGATIFSFMGSPVLNDAAQIAFRAFFRTEETTGPPDDNTDMGLFVYRKGQSHLIVRVGDEFVVDESNPLAETTKIIAEINFSNAQSGGQDGGTSAFNAAGLLAFGLEFTDGSSGIFTAQIPEPGVGLLLIGIAITGTRRKYATK